MADDAPRLITRRRSLILLGSSAGGLFVAGCGSSGGTALAGSADGNHYVADAAQACVLTAEQEEGPYYVALHKVRHDLTGGERGARVPDADRRHQRQDLQADRERRRRHLALQRGGPVLRQESSSATASPSSDAEPRSGRRTPPLDAEPPPAPKDCCFRSRRSTAQPPDRTRITPLSRFIAIVRPDADCSPRGSASWRRRRVVPPRPRVVALAPRSTGRPDHQDEQAQKPNNDDHRKDGTEDHPTRMPTGCRVPSRQQQRGSIATGAAPD